MFPLRVIKGRPQFTYNLARVANIFKLWESSVTRGINYSFSSSFSFAICTCVCFYLFIIPSSCRHWRVFSGGSEKFRSAGFLSTTGLGTDPRTTGKIAGVPTPIRFELLRVENCLALPPKLSFSLTPSFPQSLTAKRAHHRAILALSLSPSLSPHPSRSRLPLNSIATSRSLLHAFTRLVWWSRCAPVVPGAPSVGAHASPTVRPTDSASHTHMHIKCVHPMEY